MTNVITAHQKLALAKRYREIEAAIAALFSAEVLTWDQIYEVWAAASRQTVFICHMELGIGRMAPESSRLSAEDCDYLDAEWRRFVRLEQRVSPLREEATAIVAHGAHPLDAPLPPLSCRAFRD